MTEPAPARPEIQPWLQELVAEEQHRRDNQTDGIDEYLDAVFGPTTTEYHLRGRIRGVPYDIKINPLHYSRRMIADELLKAWREADAPIIPMPRWQTWTEADQFNRRKAYGRMCERHLVLLAEGDSWDAFEVEREALLAALETVQ